MTEVVKLVNKDMETASINVFHMLKAAKKKGKHSGEINRRYF